MSDQESKFYDMIFRRNDREENERVNRINRLDFPFIAREGAMDDEFRLFDDIVARLRRLFPRMGPNRLPNPFDFEDDFEEDFEDEQIQPEDGYFSED